MVDLMNIGGLGVSLLDISLFAALVLNIILSGLTKNVYALFGWASALVLFMATIVH